MLRVRLNRFHSAKSPTPCANKDRVCKYLKNTINKSIFNQTELCVFLVNMHHIKNLDNLPMKREKVETLENLRQLSKSSTSLGESSL